MKNQYLELKIMVYSDGSATVSGYVQNNEDKEEVSVSFESQVQAIEYLNKLYKNFV